MKNRNKSTLFPAVLTVVLTVIYFVCYFSIVIINRSPSGTMFSFMNTKIILSSCNGILVSVQMLIGLIFSTMTLRIPKILAYALPSFSIVSTCLFIARSRNPEGLPGVVMLLVELTAIAIIFSQIRRREKEALTDYLTGFHNRRSIMNSLDRMVRNKKPFGILYIDIDDFKLINDNYGHETGDRVVVMVAKRISEIIGSRRILGRIGGDEFVVIIPGVNDINKLSMKIMDSIKQEIIFEDAGTAHYITASIGIAKFPQDAKTSSELIRYADIAMYNVKTTGKNAVRCFEKEFETELTRISGIEALAKKYLADRSFSFAYQPQYTAGGKVLRGFETLLRINDEDRKMTSIQELVAVAERSDIIYQIDRYVLTNALAEFKDNVTKHPDILLSVNASAKHFSKKGFVEIVKQALYDTGFPPECLEIEITEYCMANSLNATISNMNQLHELGIKIALDDFGTGYASLSNLSKLPVNLLKIDKSFIDELANGNDSANTEDFVSAIISMGHILGCEVISEGVESQAQLDILKKKNCDYIQGFLWGAPLNIKMATKLCEDISE